MAELDLVFEGGGAKGTAFVGALEVLEKAGHSSRRQIGTSAGAIAAALTAAGYTAAELLQAITARTPDDQPIFTSFLDAPERRDFSDAEIEGSVTSQLLREADMPGVPEWMERRLDRQILNGLLRSHRYRQLFSFVEKGGFFEGGALVDWIGDRFAAKDLGRYVTFAELAATTGADLNVAASDVDEMEMLVFNHRTSPDLPVAWGVRMSMSIPFVWQEVVWRKEWGRYRGREKTGNVVVDGGVLSNFPLRLIAEPDSVDREVMGEFETDRTDNLGLLIDDEKPVPGQPAQPNRGNAFSRLRTVERISRIVGSMMKAADTEMLLRYDEHVCRIPAQGYGTLEFDLEGQRLEDFLEGGRRAMRAHLKKRKFN